MYAVRKKVKEETDSYLPLSLPYPAEDVQTFEKVEKNDRDRITVTVGDALQGTYTASELYGKRMVLEYRSATEADQKRIEQEGRIFEVTAYRVNMIPVLKVDGETVAEGETVPLGTSADMTLKVHFDNRME